MLIENYKKELEKVDFEKLSDNDNLIIAISAKTLIDFTKRQPTVEKEYIKGREDAIDDYIEMLTNEWTIDSILCATDKYKLIAIFKRIAEQLMEQKND